MKTQRGATPGRRAIVARDYWAVALVAIAASVPGLLNDFVYDDLAIIRDNVRVHDLAHWREILTLPYWPPPFVEQLYRPVAVLMIAIEYALGGGSPLVFRLVSYALYVACSIGMLRLASRVLSPGSALAAAVVFAAHPVHVEAVALGVNQGELIVGLIAVSMVTLYIDARRAGTLGLRDWSALVALYTIAALTKENGFILPGLLLCAELTVIPARSGRGRVSELALGYGALIAVGVGLFALRANMLPTVAVIPVADLRGLSLAGRAVAMLAVVPTWFRLLTFPAALRVDYHLGTDPGWQVALRGVGVLLICAAVGVAFRMRRAPAVAFGIAWCTVALFPVSNLIPTGVLVGERTLFLASVGFLIAVGGAAAAVLERRPGPIFRQRLLILCGVMTALGLVKSAVRELSWNSTYVRIVGPKVKSN